MTGATNRTAKKKRREWWRGRYYVRPPDDWTDIEQVTDYAQRLANYHGHAVAVIPTHFGWGVQTAAENQPDNWRLRPRADRQRRVRWPKET